MKCYKYLMICVPQHQILKVIYVDTVLLLAENGFCSDIENSILTLENSVSDWKKITGAITNNFFLELSYPSVVY